MGYWGSFHSFDFISANYPLDFDTEVCSLDYTGYYPNLDFVADRDYSNLFIDL